VIVHVNQMLPHGAGVVCSVPDGVGAGALGSPGPARGVPVGALATTPEDTNAVEK
jgi:hypothetical protein